MFRKVRSMDSVQSWICVLIVAAISLVAVMTVGNPSANSFESSTGKTFQQLMGEAMTSMDRGMESANMTGDPDHDFAAMMIPHHQGAIDMAKAELLYGKDPAMRRLAQEIIVTQEQEIDVMRMRLKQLTAR